MTPEEVYIDVLRSGHDEELDGKNPFQQDALDPSLLEPKREDLSLAEMNEGSPLLSLKTQRSRKRSRVSVTIHSLFTSAFSDRRKQ